MDRPFVNQYVSDAVSGARKSYSASTNVNSVFKNTQRIKNTPKQGNRISHLSHVAIPPSSPILSGFIEL